MTPTWPGKAFTRVKHTDWRRYRSLLEEVDPLPFNNINSTRELDEASTSLAGEIHLALDRSTVTKTVKFTKYGVLPPDLLEVIRHKNRVKKLAYRTADPAVKNQANQLSNRVRALLKEHYNDSFSRQTAELSNDDNSLFKFARRLTKGARKQLPHLLIENRTVCIPQEKAELFAQNLYSQFSENPTLNRPKHTSVVRTYNVYKDTEFLPDHHPVTLDEVQGVLSAINIKKAPGLDCIPNKALKNAPENVALIFAHITNAIFRLGHFPATWKEAKIILIGKRGEDPKLLPSYRPISLLSHSGKVVEKIIKARIQEFTDLNNIIPEEQFGFTALQGTVNQTTRMASQILAGFNRRFHTGALYLDVAKAFDRVWHKGLIIKMLKLAYPRYLTKTIDAYLSNRRFLVEVDFHRSNFFDIRAGVPQGSPLSPLLYNIFTYDIPKGNHTQLYLYADDTAILSTAGTPRLILSRLGAHMSKIERWMADWKIKLNPVKTQAVWFTRGRPVIDHRLIVGNRPIDWSSQVRYLGLMFDKGLTWKSNTLFFTRKANTQMAILFPLFNRNSLLSTPNKVLLYKCIIRAILTFGIPTWFTCAPCYRRAVQRSQNKALKLIVDAPRYTRTQVLHNDLRVETIDQFAAKIINAYFAKVDTSPNPAIYGSHFSSRPNDRFKLPRDLVT